MNYDCVVARAVVFAVVASAVLHTSSYPVPDDSGVRYSDFVVLGENEPLPEPLDGPWSEDMKLANASSESEAPRVAVVGSNIHVVFEDARDGNFEIYYKRSMDSGLTWGDDVRLTDNPEISKHPSVAANGSFVHVVWANWDWKTYMGESSRELFYKRSEDNGTTWTEDIQLTEVFDSLVDWATIAVNGSNVHVVWSDARNYPNWEIYYKRSTDNGYTWSGDIRLTNDPSHSGCPEIAVSGSTVHTIWSDSRLGPYEVFYKMSTDNGATWSADSAISSLDFEPTYVNSIDVFGDTVHVAMTDDRYTVFPDMNYEIFYVRSTDNGNTWDSEIRLTDAPGDSDAADIAINQTNVYVAWQDNRSGTRQIYFKRSADNGLTWEPEVQLTAGDKNALWPRMATKESQIHVVWFDWAGSIYGAVWNDDRIFYTRSVDDGLTWQNVEILTDTSSTSYTPAFAVSGEVIHVLWYDFNGSLQGPDLFYKRSTDNGTTWDDDLILASDPAFPLKYPAVGVNRSNVHVVWTSEKDLYGTEVYYKGSTDNGTTWNFDTRLTDNRGYSLYPAVAVNGSQIHVVWTDDRDGNFEIYCKRSMDDGKTWTADSRLTDSLADSTYPSIAANGSNVHVVWQDERDGNWEVYYKNSTDGGATWSSDRRLTSDSGDSEKPKVAVNGITIQVVWSDGRDGNWEIYYKNSTDNGMTWSLDCRLTMDPSDSRVPTLAADESDVHVVWQDRRDGNWEVYYKNSSDDGSTWGADTRVTNAINSSCSPVIVAASGVRLIWMDDRTGLRGIYYRHSIGFPPDTDPPTAPTLQRAVLSGVNLENVDMGWDASEDEGQPGGTVKYEVWRATEYSGPYSYLDEVSANGSQSYAYLDLGAGHGNSSDYFYAIYSVDESFNKNTTEDIAGKFSRPLQSGIEFISIPLVQENESLESILQTVEYDKVWFYDSSSQEWKWFMEHKGYRRGLWNVNHTTGVWVSISEDSNLTVAGIVPAQTTIHLLEGWNLVGFPSFSTTYTVADLKVETGATRVEGYDAAPPNFLRVLGDLEVLEAGQAYWVRADTIVDWIVEAS